MLLQLQDLILWLFILDFRLSKIVNITRLYILIIEITNFFSKIVAIFILINKKNNTKNYLYIKINIDLQY